MSKTKSMVVIIALAIVECVSALIDAELVRAYQHGGKFTYAFGTIYADPAYLSGISGLLLFIATVWLIAIPIFGICVLRKERK
jgi:predicted metal-binding protein